MAKTTNTWPVQWYANGELQHDVIIRLSDTEIKIITMLIENLNKEHTNAN